MYRLWHKLLQVRDAQNDMAQGNIANSIAQQKIVRTSIEKRFFSKSGAVFSRKM